MASCTSCRWPAAKPWSFATAFGAPITAPVAVADGRVYVPCEDGYLYVLGPGGKAPLPTKDLEVVEDPQSAHRAARRRQIRLVHQLRRLRRHERQRAGPRSRRCGCAGPAGWKAPSSTCRSAAAAGCTRTRPKGRSSPSSRTPAGCCGGGTGPTSISRSRRRSTSTASCSCRRPASSSRSMRCLDAATGKLLWEAPFTGSPSWSRQFPPVVHGNLAIYASGSGEYASQGTEKPFTFKGTPEPAPTAREVMSLDLFQRQSVLPQGQSPAALGLGPRHRQGRLAEGLFRVRPRRQRLRHLPAGRQALLFDVLRLRGQPAGTPRPAAGEQRPDRLPRPADGRRRLADEQVLRHRQVHALRPRRPPLHRRQQPGQRRHQGPLRLVPGRQGRLARLAVRPDHLGAERRHRGRAVHLLQRPARPRQRLRPRRPARSSAASITTTPAAASRCRARTSSARTWT